MNAPPPVAVVAEERLRELRTLAADGDSIHDHAAVMLAIDELLLTRHRLQAAAGALEAGAAALDHVNTLRLTRAPNARENCVKYAAALRDLVRKGT